MANLCRLLGHSPSIRRSVLADGGEWQSQCRWCGSTMVKYWGRQWQVTDGKTALLSLPHQSLGQPMFAWKGQPATGLRNLPPWGGDLVDHHEMAELAAPAHANQRHPH